MPRIDVDFSAVDEPVAPGLYPFEVSSSRFTQTKGEDHSDMIQWELTLTKPGPFYGRKLTFYSNLANKKTAQLPDGTVQLDVNAAKQANYYLREFLKTIKAPWDKQGFATEDAHHCKGIAKVELQDGQDGSGRKFNRINTILPWSEEQAAAL